MKHYLLPFISGIFLSVCSMNAQTETRIITNDSLAGFNEQQYRDAAKYKGITAEEMDIYLSYSRRDFIKTKYNLHVSIPEKFAVPENYSAKTSTAACNNEDFEARGITTPVPAVVTVTLPSDISGWTVSKGTNNGATGSCLLGGCCTLSVTLEAKEIGTGLFGYIDPIIGSSYPIYSVFGDTLNNGNSVNGFNCYGDWFTQINNASAGAGINRITKIINVTPSNANFKFASIAVAQGAHCCCDNVGIAINFKDCLGNFLATSAQFSVSPSAGVGCNPSGPCNTGSPVTFLNTSTAGWLYNKWKLDSVDLSLWLGSCITVEVTAIDCPYSGHAGYAYFDAQCGPLLSTNINSNFYATALKIYPNPNNGTFTVFIPEDNKTFELEIRNVLGQLVYEQNISKNENTVHCEYLSRGVYSYTFLENNIAIKTGKLIIE